jgi:hypothetical protein
MNLYLNKARNGSVIKQHNRSWFLCSKSNPEYEGVIDDEEFTSYLYPVDEGLWEIAEDPTGMARKIMEKEKHHKGSWFE